MVDTHVEKAAAMPRRKKYVTRACDACKKRKSKCDGSEPCSRCVNSDIVCAYKSTYNRVQRKQQIHGPRMVKDKRRRTTSAIPDVGTGATPQKAPTEIPDDHDADLQSTMETGEDEGDASNHTFLRRVSGHLALVGQGLPRYLFKREEETLPGLDHTQTFLLPSEEVAKRYIECYFEHSNVTYRYIHRGRTMDLISRIYKEDNAVLRDDTTMAVILLALALGCIWTSSWRNEPLANYRPRASRLLQIGQLRLEKASASFPPTLGILQAHVLKLQTELAFNRYNSAWMTLGTAIRLGQMIDIQKEDPLNDTVDEFCRRGVFWGLYMIDRYLSASLGRPMAISDRDVTIPFPSTSVNSRIGTEEARIAEGVKAHAKLTRIVGEAIARLYPGVKSSVEPRVQAVADLEGQLAQWLRETPKFFHPPKDEDFDADDGFYDLRWVYRRQQKTIRSAFYYANMLLYRGYLLNDFLHQVPSTPLSKPPSPQIIKCVDFALEMAKMAAVISDDCTYNATYWTTSYFIFCSISVLLVYLTMYRDSDDREHIEAIIEKAMKGHRKLSDTTNFTAQKLLEESRSRVAHVRNSDAPSTGPSHATPGMGVEDTGLHTGIPNLEPALSPNLPINDMQQLPEMWNGTIQDGQADILESLSYELDPLGDGNGLGMIMDIGFDNAAMPPNLSGAGGMYRF